MEASVVVRITLSWGVPSPPEGGQRSERANSGKKAPIGPSHESHDGTPLPLSWTVMAIDEGRTMLIGGPPTGVAVGVGVRLGVAVGVGVRLGVAVGAGLRLISTDGLGEGAKWATRLRTEHGNQSCDHACDQGSYSCHKPSPRTRGRSSRRVTPTRLRWRMHSSKITMLT